MIWACVHAWGWFGSDGWQAVGVGCRKVCFEARRKVVSSAMKVTAVLVYYWVIREPADRILRKTGIDFVALFFNVQLSRENQQIERKDGFIQDPYNHKQSPHTAAQDAIFKSRLLYCIFLPFIFSFISIFFCLYSTISINQIHLRR